MQSQVTLEIDNKKYKFESREAVALWEILSDSPWRLKFENSIRQNSFNSFNSWKFLKEEAMPTKKSSVALEY
jgi:hypothetical protein